VGILGRGYKGSYTDMRKLALVLIICLFACSRSKAAFPVTIPNVNTGYDTQANTSGSFIFKSGINKYAFLFQGACCPFVGSDGKLHAMKSTNGGNTWIEQDSTHAKTLPYLLGAGATYTVAVDGTKVMIMALDGTNTPSFTAINLYTYNLATDLWGGSPVVYNSPLPDFDWNSGGSATNAFIQLVVRGTNDYLFFFSGTPDVIATVKRGRLYLASFNGTTFGTTTRVPNQSVTAVSYFGIGVVVTKNGGTQLIYCNDVFSAFNGYSLFSVGVDGTNTFGTTQLVSGNVYLKDTPLLFSNPNIYANGGIETIGVAGWVYDSGAGSTQEIHLFHAPTTLNPTWADSVVTLANDDTLVTGAGVTYSPTNSAPCWNNIGTVGRAFAIGVADGSGNVDVLGNAYMGIVNNEQSQFYGLSTNPGELVIVWTTNTLSGDGQPRDTIGHYFYSHASPSVLTWSAKADLFDPTIIGAPNSSPVAALQVYAGASIPSTPLVPQLQNYVMSDNPNFLQKTNFIRSN
jgi:hypothetical protein